MKRTLLTLLIVLAVSCDNTSGANNINNSNNSNNANNTKGQCGDGVRDLGEDCDGNDLNGQSCLAVGFEGGELGCDGSCHFDFSACVEECQDSCTEGATRCQETVIETCTLGDDGCYVFTPGVDCSDTALVCSDLEGSASCAMCVDLCEEGEHQCSGDLLQGCVLGPEGCYVFETERDCVETGQRCDPDGTEGPSCSDTCVDVCTPNNYQCDGDAIEFCEIQPHGCYGWSLHEDCGTSGQTCDDSAWPPVCADCVDECTVESATRCDGELIETCTLNTSGCMVWDFTEDCSLSGEFCEDHTGTAMCVTTCTSICNPTGSTQCNGTMIEECQTQSSGCRDWVLSITVPTTGRFVMTAPGPPLVSTIVWMSAPITGAIAVMGTISKSAPRILTGATIGL